MKKLIWKKHPVNGRVLVALEGTPVYDFFGEWDNQEPLSETEQQACRKILETGGTYLLWVPRDPDAKNYAERGQAFSNTRVTRRRGLPNQCHRNVCAYVMTHDTTRHAITTGYALSEDGMWRQHSFLTRKDGSIIETTTQRAMYFGYRMNAAEAMDFIASNL